MNLKITLFETVFIFNYNHPYPWILILKTQLAFVEGPHCKYKHVKYYKHYNHVLCHPANSKSVFLSFVNIC